MTMLDGHIHIAEGSQDRADFTRRVQEAGVEGGVIISLAPASFRAGRPTPSAEERLDNLFFWSDAGPAFHPFYWIDPLEDNAIEQVALAVDRGVMGFKVICDRFHPGDPRALEVFKAVAVTRRPILFHCGILWDGKPSSAYNRPGGFEELLRVEGLRFALAHLGWPWCDELLAVYGKFLNAYAARPDLSVEMFIDTTPGTPPIYRRDALAKLFTIGYDVENNVIFGSDCNTGAYNADWVKEWRTRDSRILDELQVSAEVREKVFGRNLERFLGVSAARVERKLPRPGQ